MRKKFIFFAIGLVFLTSTQSVRAQTASATSGLIELEPEEPLFLEANVWYPGLSLTRYIEINNRDNQSRQLVIRGENLSPGGDLSAVIYLSIVNQEGICLYGCGGQIVSLKQFAASSEIILAETIAPLSKRRLAITAIMDPQADNNYQGLMERLDFVFGFSPVTPTLSPTKSPSPSPASVGGGIGGCSASAPGAPINLLAAPAGPGQVFLSWQSPGERVTHYSILYGPSSGNYLYGNPDIGKNTSYFVSGLTPAANYYFVVVAVNDCAPGPYSNEASAVAAGGLGTEVEAAGPAPGFGVLGEATRPGQIAGGVATEAGEIAGLLTEEKSCFWWLIFSLLALAGNSLYCYRRRKELGEKHYYWLGVIGISSLSYWADREAHRWWTPLWPCSWMFFWAGLSFFLPTGFWWFWWRKKK